MEFRPLRKEDIDCRIATIKENGLSLLLYKNARVDMRMLDEAVGSTNWKRSHQVIDGNLYCTIEIWDAEKQQWISKQDVGTESYTEKEKGQASDSFKRAGFNWGIGRELYTAPFVWISPEDANIKTNKTKDRFYCNDNFIVSDITIENGVITSLEITNESNGGKVVFTFPKKRARRKQEPKEPQEEQVTISQAMYSVLCSLCKKKGKNIKEVVNSYGVEKPAEMLVTVWEKAVADLKELPDAEE